MKGQMGSIELSLILAAVMAVAILVMFNLTISHSLVKWQAIKSCFYIAHQISAPPNSCEHGIVVSEDLDYILDEEFHKLKIFAYLYDVESRSFTKSVYQTEDDDTSFGSVKGAIGALVKTILDSAASGTSETIKIPKEGTGSLTDSRIKSSRYSEKFYIYTLPVTIGCDEGSRKQGYLTVGALVKNEFSETLANLFCEMVRLTGAQIDIYGEECGIVNSEGGVID